MVWPLLAVAALSFVGQGQQAKAAAVDNRGQNKAILEANRENQKRTGFQVGLLNVQRGQRLRQLSQQKSDLSVSELSELSAAANNAAASGTVGSSVDAVQSDVRMQYDRARDQLGLESELEDFNYTTQLYEILQAGRDKLVDGVKFKGPSQLSMLGNAAMEAGSMYLGGQMNLGLGSKAKSGVNMQGQSRALTNNTAFVKRM